MNPTACAEVSAITWATTPPTPYADCPACGHLQMLHVSIPCVLCQMEQRLRRLEMPGVAIVERVLARDRARDRAAGRPDSGPVTIEDL